MFSIRCDSDSYEPPPASGAQFFGVTAIGLMLVVSTFVLHILVRLQKVCSTRILQWETFVSVAAALLPMWTMVWNASYGPLQQCGAEGFSTEQNLLFCLPLLCLP